MTIPSPAQCSVRKKRLRPECTLFFLSYDNVSCTLQYKTLRFSNGKPPFMLVMLMLQVLDDPAEDNLHMGMQKHFSYVQIFLSIFALSVLGTYVTNKCSYLLFIIQIISCFLPYCLRGSHIMQKSSIRSQLGRPFRHSVCA